MAEVYTVIYCHDAFETTSQPIWVYPSTEGAVPVWATEPSLRAVQLSDMWAQSITQTYFRDHIQRYLPAEWWLQDAKEDAGNGTLDYLTQTFALTLDEIKQAVDQFTALIDIDTCPSNYLRAIADWLDYPLEPTDTVTEQRQQLKNAIYWYRKKGAVPAFEAILYAFGFDANVIPLWSTKDATQGGYGTYEIFYETPPGVARGTTPPNDWSGLLENGGVWFQSPHFGIRLEFIVGDRYHHAEYVDLDPTASLLTNEDFETTPDLTGWTSHIGAGAITVDATESAEGSKSAKLTGSGSNNTYLEQTVTVTPNTMYNLDVKGHGDGSTSGYVRLWDVANSVELGAALYVDRGSEFRKLPIPIETPDGCTQLKVQLWAPDGSGNTWFDSVLLTISPAYANIKYYFDNTDFSYIYRRIEHIRPVFAVLEWLEFMTYYYDVFTITSTEEWATVDAYSSEKGWYLGYCDEDDPVYTRLDARLLGSFVDGNGTLPGTAPPYRRTGTAPLGSTVIKHKRYQEEGYCHPPEDLIIDVGYVANEPYQLPLTRNGLGLYPSVGTGSYSGYIDRADFPSRGFTDASSNPGHANTFTRETGYGNRPLSVLQVSAETRITPTMAESRAVAATPINSTTKPTVAGTAVALDPAISST